MSYFFHEIIKYLNVKFCFLCATVNKLWVYENFKSMLFLFLGLLCTITRIENHQ